MTTNDKHRKINSAQQQPGPYQEGDDNVQQTIGSVDGGSVVIGRINNIIHQDTSLYSFLLYTTGLAFQYAMLHSVMSELDEWTHSLVTQHQPILTINGQLVPIKEVAYSVWGSDKIYSITLLYHLDTSTPEWSPTWSVSMPATASSLVSVIMQVENNLLAPQVQYFYNGTNGINSTTDKIVNILSDHSLGHSSAMPSFNICNDVPSSAFRLATAADVEAIQARIREVEDSANLDYTQHSFIPHYNHEIFDAYDDIKGLFSGNGGSLVNWVLEHREELNNFVHSLPDATDFNTFVLPHENVTPHGSNWIEQTPSGVEHTPPHQDLFFPGGADECGYWPLHSPSSNPTDDET